MNRPGVAVCIVGAGAGEELPTPSEVPILTVPTEAEAFEHAAPADVVLLRPGCRVAPGWLEALQAAAHASANTATATALTQHDLGGAIAGPFEEAAAAVQRTSLRIRPRIETPGDAACVYVRRSALDLAGYAAGEDFRTRCVELGLAHVLADDVLVLDQRPAQSHAAEHEPSPPATRARAAARRALSGLSATIDASILSGPTTGTHVHVLELIAGLARTEQVRLTAILPDQPSEHALARLRALPRVDLLTYREASRAHRADVVHRPFQVSNAGVLSFLRSLGERLLVTQQDLIGFHNPAYFPNAGAWRDYRELTCLALRTADRVLFFSAHARDDALAEELVEPPRASVVHLGVDHPNAPTESARPAGAERIEAAQVLLCLGTDYLHKNRLFALRLLQAMGEQGLEATLVFAGPTVAHGSSRPQEQRFLADHPPLASAVIDLGPVTEAEKTWLYERAALVVYPSVLEGFGLVPFEAAAHKTPCLWAPGSALSELLPDEAAGIVPWDPGLSAEHAGALLQDATARESNLSAIATAARSLTWDATAHRLLELYRAVAEAPARPPSADGGLPLTEDAARLVGPGGELPPDLHRPLLALATHPRLAGPAFAALKLGYRLLQRRR